MSASNRRNSDRNSVQVSQDFHLLEAPLRRLDPEIHQFAESHRLVVSKNVKGWPERSIEWDTSSGIHCLIQIFMSDADNTKFNVWICAGKTIRGIRKWKNKYIRKERSVDEIQSNLPKILDRSRKTILSWRDSDLEPAPYQPS